MLKDNALVKNLLAFMLLISFQLSISALFRFEIPEGNRDMVTYMLGQLSGMASTVLLYFFSTTQGSNNKDNVIANLASTKEVIVKNTEQNPVNVTETNP